MVSEFKCVGDSDEGQWVRPRRSAHRSQTLHAVCAVALGLVVLGGGCGGANPDAATRTLATDTAAVTERGIRYSYDGKTVAELFAMTDTYRTDSLIHLVEEALQQRARADLSAPERVVLAIEALEREVNNGGYNQFFLNEPSYAHEIVAALNEIGCPENRPHHGRRCSRPRASSWLDRRADLGRR